MGLRGMVELGPTVVVVIKAGATVAVVVGVTVGIVVATRVVGFAGGGVEVVWAVVGAAVAWDVVGAAAEGVEVKEVVAFVKLEPLVGSASTVNWCRAQASGSGDVKSLGGEQPIRAIKPRVVLHRISKLLRSRYLQLDRTHHPYQHGADFRSTQSG